MPSFERGVYEPPNDDIHVFDDDADVDEEGSRLPLLIVIALMVLAAFAGVVWLAYSQGVQRGRADAPRMIVAAPGPVREAANENSNGSRSLKIYEQPAPADHSADDSAPTQPANKPAPSSPMVAAAPPVTKPAPAAIEAPKPQVVTPKPVIVLPKPVALTPKPVEKLAVKPATTKPDTAIARRPSPETAIAPPTPITAAPNPPEVTPKPVEAATHPTDVAPKPAAIGGAYALQIGAYKSQADADAAWKSYQSKHPVAGRYAEDVRKADLGDKGIWYRLRIVSFADKASASALCEKLKADGGACMLAK